MTAVGLAAFFAKDKIKEWSGVVVETKEQVKAAAEETAKWHAEITKTHEAFAKLSQAASGPEAESAKAIAAYLSQRPNAVRAAAAIAAGIGADVAQRELAPDEQRRYAAESAAAGRGEQAMESILAQQAAAGFTPEQLAASREQLSRAFGVGRHRAGADALIEAGRQRYTERVVTGATAAGPAGAASREELLRRAGGMPGLAELTPDAIEAREERNRVNRMHLEQQVRLRNAEAERFERDKAQRERADEQTRRDIRQQAQHDDAEWRRKDRDNIQREIRRQEAGDRRNQEAERRYQAQHGGEMAAHQDYLRAVQGALTAQEQRIQMWRRATQSVRQLQRNNATVGLP